MPPNASHMPISMPWLLLEDAFYRSRFQGCQFGRFWYRLSKS
jgi:hypothetical protein